MMERTALALAAAATIAWVWTCLCLYPSHDWNAMRLAPSFMLRAGVSPYPGPLEGPVTTWIYGPIPILLQLPATFAGTAAQAVLGAALINLLVTLAPLAFALRRQAAGPGATATVQAWALLLALAAWPAVNLIFCQADNAAIALGLIAGAVLADAGPRDQARLWFAAGAATLALWSKQTELGPVLGQLVFIALRHGGRAAAGQAMRCVAAGGMAGLIFCGLFGADGLIYNMFVLPGGIPGIALGAKLADPLYRSHVVAHLSAYVAAPLVILAWKRQRVFRRDSATLLPALVFLFSLPFNLAGLLTVGGNINSLHGAVYLLPAAALWLAGRPRLRIITLLAVLGLQSSVQWPLLWRPAVAGLHQGRSLASQLPGQIYFPWNPLFTYFADHRFDHAEDGLLTRAVAGRPVPPALIRAHLPPHLSVVAYHGFVIDGYVRHQLIPAGARREQYGEWILYLLPAPTP
jgi:hypothetical protein